MEEKLKNLLAEFKDFSELNVATLIKEKRIYGKEGMLHETDTSTPFFCFSGKYHMVILQHLEPSPAFKERLAVNTIKKPGDLGIIFPAEQIVLCHNGVCAKEGEGVQILYIETLTERMEKDRAVALMKFLANTRLNEIASFMGLRQFLNKSEARMGLLNMMPEIEEHVPPKYMHSFLSCTAQYYSSLKR